MGIADLFIRKKVITILLILLTLVGGYLSYNRLPRFEDPEFVIRQAMITTPYPGARPNEVAEEVTEVVETAVQQLQEVKEITSTSKAGVSEVKVEMELRFARTKDDLQILWTKLRNKLKDIEGQLPPGAGPINVNDDFGDVYALFFAVTGEGYSYAEIKDYLDDLRREILLVPGVARVAFLGEQQEAIFIEISHTKAAQLGISPDAIYQTLKQQNVVVPAGKVKVGPEYIEVSPTGAVDSVTAIEDLLIAGGNTERQIRLSDVATVRREYRDPPRCILRYDGKPAIGIGVSNVAGGNVVETSKAVSARLRELDALRPIGMDLHTISDQGQSVEVSVKGFVVNLLEALAIVVITLLIFMGIRSGFIMGAVLLLTVCGTLIAMLFDGIAMQRISLGALIIALGMLVDNAIVVTEGILIRIQQGQERVAAAREVVGQTIWPLLGGTVVGILAFSAIGFSPDNTGEYAGSLFWVICYSLFLSWVFAITFTPFLCIHFLKTKPLAGSKDPYDAFVFRAYKSLLSRCLKNRWLTSGALLLLLVAAGYGFGFVPSGFFPDSSRPQFVVDYWLSEGSDIREVSKDLEGVEKWVAELDGVTHVTSITGMGALRFILTYNPESPSASYGQLLVDVADFRKIPELINTIQDRLDNEYPDAQAKAWKFVLGPGGGSKIQASFRGTDPNVLRELSEQAKQIYNEEPDAIAVKDDWRERTKVVRPVFDEARARRAGVTLADMNNALQTTFTGSQVGIYRERDMLIPIVSRLPENERRQIDNIQDIQVYSPLSGRYIPLEQVASAFPTVFENAMIRRVDRFPTIKAQCDPRAGVLASEVFERLRPKIETLPLPPGYGLEWKGEYGDSKKAQQGLVSTLPFCLVAMVLVVFFLFNSVRQPVLIWLAVPLAIIGVTIGLLVFRAPFEFMAILGFLSLVGMLIKNAIVLVDQTDMEIREGKPRFRAIIESSVSRVRPVSMGALTTVLGVMPLLLDPFFRSMAVTIMFGLTFATVLTLVVVPVLYAIFFRIGTNEV